MIRPENIDTNSCAEKHSRNCAVSRGFSAENYAGGRTPLARADGVGRALALSGVSSLDLAGPSRGRPLSLGPVSEIARGSCPPAAPIAPAGLCPDQPAGVLSLKEPRHAAE